MNRSATFLAAVLALTTAGGRTARTAEPPDPSSPWTAGTARASITPRESMWMSGYAGRTEPAQGWYSDLMCKALVVQHGTTPPIILVTLDLIGIDRDLSLEIRKRIAKAHNLDMSRIVLATSHTHSGPVVGANLAPMYELDGRQRDLVDQYSRRLVEQVLEVVETAATSRRPARISHGSGTAAFAVNRRNNPEARVPELRRSGSLQGPVDHDVPVLTVHHGDDLAAAVFGYACHATVLSGLEWCADYPGFAQTEFERRHPSANALFWAGCGGDQNPLPRRDVALAQDYGRQLADAVDRVLENKQLTTMTGPVTSDHSEIPLAFDAVPHADELRAISVSENVYEARRARALLRVLNRDARLPSTYPFPVQTWHFTDGPAWVFLGGEVVVDYALLLKEKLAPDPVWVAAYCNDVMAYIPSERVLAEGGYEGGGSMVYYGLPSRWAPGLEDRIVREVTRQLGSPASAP